MLHRRLGHQVGAVAGWRVVDPRWGSTRSSSVVWLSQTISCRPRISKCTRCRCTGWASPVAFQISHSSVESECRVLGGGAVPGDGALHLADQTHGAVYRGVGPVDGVARVVGCRFGGAQQGLQPSELVLALEQRHLAGRVGVRTIGPKLIPVG